GDAPLGRAGRLTRRIGGQARPLVRAIAPEVELDRPAAADRVEEGECVAQVLAGELGRTDADSPARLVDDDRAFLGLFLGGGECGQHGVKGELGRLADDVDRLLGVGDVGQLDDDPAIAGGLYVGLDGAHRVDATSQHFDRPLDDGGVDGDRVGVPGFVDELGATPEVEAEAGLGGDEDVGAACDDLQRHEEAPAEPFGQHHEPSVRERHQTLTAAGYQHARSAPVPPANSAP